MHHASYWMHASGWSGEEALITIRDLMVLEGSELRAVSMKFSYVLRRGSTVIAEGWTRLGCIDERHKLIRIQDPMRDVLLAGELEPPTGSAAPSG